MAAAKLTAAWWTKNMQVGVKGKDLTGALQKFEKKKKTAQASCSVKDWDDVDDLVEDIIHAAKEAKDKCNARLHKKTIKYLDDMLKQADLEQKTAKQMLSIAKIGIGMKANLLKLRKVANIAEAAERRASKINMTVAKLNRPIDQWLQERNTKKLDEALRILIGLKSEASKIKGVSDANFKTNILRLSDAAKTAKSPPAVLKADIQEILEIRENTLVVHAAANEACKLLDEKFKWLEAELTELSA